MRLVVAIIFIVAACGGTASGPTQSASAASVNWLEFNEHIVVSSTEASSIFAEWPDVTDDATDDAQAQKLQRWVDREKEWLFRPPLRPLLRRDLRTVVKRRKQLWRVREAHP